MRSKLEKSIENIDEYRYNVSVDKIFKALADKNRRKILTLLKNRELSVSEILENFDIGQATISNHLSILRKAGLVRFTVKGKLRVYRLDYELFSAFIKQINNFLDVNQNRVPGEIVMRKKN